MAAPNEPPPPYTENAPGAPPRHTNDIPLPDSPITTHNPEPIPPGQQSWYHQQRQQRQQRQQAPPEPRPPKQSSSAAQYFGSRPHRSVRTIPLALKPNSIRADFDYPRSWAPDHDVSLQDWTTFVGFLIPDGAPVSDDKRLSPERRQAVEEVLREWNDRLFIPKGLRMVVDDGTGQPGTVPERYGSSASSANTSNWSRPESTGSRPTSTSSHVPPYSHGTSSYPHQQPQSASEPFSSTTQGYNQAHTNSNAPYRQPSVSSSNHMPPGSSRERWAQKLKNVAQEKDITYSKEGIRMSDKFSLSLGGLKVGKFNLDERGMNYGGKPIGPTLPVAQYHQGPPPQTQGGYPGHGPNGGFSAGPGPGAPAPHGAHGAHGAYGGYGPPGAHHPGAQSMGGTISIVGPYKKTEHHAPPVIVSSDALPADASPPRSPWLGTASTTNVSHRRPVQKPSPAPSRESPKVVDIQPPSSGLSEVLVYLNTFLSEKQAVPDREDIKFMSKLQRQRDLPEDWKKEHQGGSLDCNHYAAALAYLVGEQVVGENECIRNNGRKTARLSGLCVKLPSHMPMHERLCFSKLPVCVGCRYWQHLQRQSNTCDWNPESKYGSRRLRTSKSARVSRESSSSSSGFTTEESSNAPVIKIEADEEVDPIDTPSEMSDSDDEEPVRTVHTRERHLRLTQSATIEREAALEATRTGPAVTQDGNKRIPRMQEWELAQGSLLEATGQWAVAWSAPYNTGREPFQIASNVSTVRLRLGPSDTYSWSADEDEFRDGEVRSGEIDLTYNGHRLATLTQGATFKVEPGDTCKIENQTVQDAWVSIHVITNYRRLAMG